MAVDMDVLRARALEVISNVVKENKLHDFTYGTYRKEVERAMSLEPGTLDAPEYKTVVHAVAKDYISKVEGDQQSEKEEVPPKKRKSSGSARKEAQPRKSRVKSSEAKPGGKGPASKSKKPAPRSASVIPTSDEDAAGSGTGAQPSSSKPKPREPAASRTRRVESESEGSRDEENSGPHMKRQKRDAPPGHEQEHAIDPEPSSAKADSLAEAAGRADDDPKSGSELSVLIDEPPARKRKKADSGESSKTKQPKSRKRNEPVKELSKDEETIKRLKSLVVACGVRKVWAKEFKGLEKPSEQIRRLKQILADLGMSGRMSMEQAKAIKAKREFEQELEDVKEFANKIASGPSARRHEQKDIDATQEEVESEVEAIPKRRTARQSIMAFLGDESE